MRMEKLKPCPFCGADVMVVRTTLSGGYEIAHEDHPGRMCILVLNSIKHINHDALVDKWNRRDLKED